MGPLMQHDAPGSAQITFAEDQSKNPPPKHGLDRALRRFARASYFGCVLLIYLVASTAMGVAVAPALWSFQHLSSWCLKLPGPLYWFGLASSCALCFFIAGLTLLVVVPIYNWILPT